MADKLRASSRSSCLFGICVRNPFDCVCRRPTFISLCCSAMINLRVFLLVLFSIVDVYFFANKHKTKHLRLHFNLNNSIHPNKKQFELSSTDFPIFSSSTLTIMRADNFVSSSFKRWCEQNKKKIIKRAKNLFLCSIRLKTSIAIIFFTAAFFLIFRIQQHSSSLR